MKKFISIFVLTSLICVSNIFANVNYIEFKHNILSTYSQKNNFKYKSTEEYEEEFYKINIPDEYSDAFLYYTQDYKELRKEFYSLMVHESCNFTQYVNKNKDGSIDMGPSQLNSKNLKNKRFIKYYRPTDESHITTKYCFYMVMSLNFYIDLVNKYGKEYAFYAYNGGEKCVNLIKNNIKDSRYVSLLKNVKYYNKRVNALVSKTEENIQSYISIEKLKIDSAKLAYDLGKLKIKNSTSHYNYKFIDNRISKYIRREDFGKFKGKELGIISKSTISRQYIKSTENNITRRS